MKPVLLVVMDGVGLRDEIEGNAFKQADTPNLDSLMSNGYAELEASGPAVGLPEGYQGNSEVGHLHLGAGRRVPQRLTRINNAVEDGSLADNPALVNAFERAEENGTVVHIAGIISDGGIHGHIDHLEAILGYASKYDVDVKVHAFTDGRDVEPNSAEKFLSDIQDWCTDRCEIATVMGRYYSMDRDKNWGRTEKAYGAMFSGEGFVYDRPDEAVEKAYDDGEYDYFVQPSVKNGFEGINPEDELIFYNYRADRERQLVEAMFQEGFDEFEVEEAPNFTSMFPYERGFDHPVIFEKKVVENTLGEKIEDAGYAQLRVAESQKIPHVTYFFNGQRELDFDHETTHFVESDKIKAFDQAPEMHADDTTEVVIEALEDGENEFMLLNYANCDLVGHTGDIDAAITAVETVDRNIGRLVDAVKNTDYVMLITADHGNCEEMGSSDDPSTSHTTNPVPLMGVNTDRDFEDGELWEVEYIISDILGLA